MNEQTIFDSMLSKVAIAVIIALLAVTIITQMSATPSANADTAQTIPTRTPEVEQFVPIIVNDQ